MASVTHILHGAAFLLLGALPTARAQITAPDSIVIRGRFDDSGPWTGYARVMILPPGIASTVSVEPEDMVCPAGVKPASQIGLADPSVQFSPGRPGQLVMRALPPHSAGRCTGQATLRTTGDSQGKSIRLILESQPVIAALGEQAITISLTQCNVFTCWAARGLTAGPAGEAVYDMLINNPGKLSLGKPTVVASLVGDKDKGQVFAPLYVAMHNGESVPYPRLRFTVNSGGMRPHRYTGHAYLSFAGFDQSLTIPMHFNVRAGPFWAIAALASGLIIGILFRLFTDRKPQLDALEQLRAIERALAHLPANDRAILDPELTALRIDILAGNLTGVPERLTRSQHRQIILVELANVVLSAASVLDPDPTLQERLIQYITDARKALIAGADGDAVTSLGAARATLTSIQANGEATLMQVPHGWHKREATPTSDPRYRRLSRLLMTRGAIYWLVLPVLVWLGLDALYASNAAFGAGGWKDYVGLITWGFSSDVVLRKLTELGNPLAGV